MLFSFDVFPSQKFSVGINPNRGHNIVGQMEDTWSQKNDDRKSSARAFGRWCVFSAWGVETTFVLTWSRPEARSPQDNDKRLYFVKLGFNLLTWEGALSWDGCVDSAGKSHPISAWILIGATNRCIIIHTKVIAAWSQNSQRYTLSPRVTFHITHVDILRAVSDLWTRCWTKRK